MAKGFTVKAKAPTKKKEEEWDIPAIKERMKGKTIVVLQASSAIRYVSHPMWLDEKLEGTEGLPVPPDLETEFPIVRWKSEDWVPPPKP